MSDIPMKPVTSSTIHSIGYDPSRRLMRVDFKSGGGVTSYHYHDVPPEAHAALAGADSHGSHFHQHVRGKFPHTKWTEDEK